MDLCSHWISFQLIRSLLAASITRTSAEVPTLILFMDMFFKLHNLRLLWGSAVNWSDSSPYWLLLALLGFDSCTGSGSCCSRSPIKPLTNSKTDGKRKNSDSGQCSCCTLTHFSIAYKCIKEVKFACLLFVFSDWCKLSLGSSSVPHLVGSCWRFLQIEADVDRVSSQFHGHHRCSL